MSLVGGAFWDFDKQILWLFFAWRHFFTASWRINLEDPDRWVYLLYSSFRAVKSCRWKKPKNPNPLSHGWAPPNRNMTKMCKVLKTSEKIVIINLLFPCNYESQFSSILVWNSETICIANKTGTTECNLNLLHPCCKTCKLSLACV